MTAAISRKLMIAVISSPKSILVSGLLSNSWTANPISLFPPSSAMSGLMIALVKASTIDANAVPMTTATARSITLPCMMKSLKPLSILHPSLVTRCGPPRAWSCVPNWTAETLPARLAPPRH